MDILHVPYSTWKRVAQQNSLTPYHVSESSNSVVAWCGHGAGDIAFRSFVGVDDYSDWNTNFAASSGVISDDDAKAHIIGISSIRTTAVQLQGTPLENDGRLNIVSAPMTQGMYAFWTGAGDDLTPAGPTSGRGEGEAVVMEFDGPGDQYHMAEFSSYVEIYDGEGVWSPPENWTSNDKFWVYFLISPNNECTISTPGSGNCNIVDTGMGFSALVPAAGNGNYTVDLDRAKPLPMSSDLNFWSTGAYTAGSAISPAISDVGAPLGDHALLYDLGYRIQICNQMPMGSPVGRFEVDSDKSEPLHKNWRVITRCQKVSSGSGTIGVWFKFFRPDTSEIDYPPTVV